MMFSIFDDPCLYIVLGRMSFSCFKVNFLAFIIVETYKNSLYVQSTNHSSAILFMNILNSVI